jgi:hypothetical protein
VRQIIDYEHILELFVADNPEILDEEAIFRFHAMLSSEHP